MKRKYLKKSEILLVHWKLRDMVLEAWRNKEKVPYGVIYLTIEKPSNKDIAKAKELIKNQLYLK